MIMNKKLAVTAILSAMISVQSGASIAKYLFRLLGPAGAVTLRVGLAGIILAIINRPKVHLYTRKQWWSIIFYGLTIGGMNISFYYGIQRVPLGVGVTVEFIGPLTLALLASRKALDFLWVFLAAAGILMIVPWNSGAGDWLGVMLVAFAGVVWAFYIIATGRLAGTMKSTDALTCGLLVAAVLSLPFSIISGDLFCLNGKLLLIGLGVAVFSSILPLFFELISMNRLTAKTFSVLQSLQPVCAALSGLVFLGEQLSLMQWCAVFCVIAASAGATMTAPEKESPAAEKENGTRRGT